MTGAFPGSFDPITSGHLDIIKKASKFFDVLFILISTNSEKHCLFSYDERVDLIKACDLPLNVIITNCKDNQFASKRALDLNASCLVRGIRDLNDAQSELKLADINREIGEIETVFLYASKHLRFVSSSLLKEMVKCNQPLSCLAPKHIEDALKEKIL